MIFNIMKKVPFILYVVTYFIFGCSYSINEEKHISLFHEVIEVPQSIIGNAYSIRKVDHFLVILDYSSDSYFHLIDLNERLPKGMYGTKGQAPDEFIHPGKLHPYNDNQLCCFDNSKGEIKILTIQVNDATIEYSTLHSLKQNNLFEALPIRGDTILANGAFEESMFQLTVQDNQILCSSEEYPYKDQSEYRFSNQLRAMAYQGVLSMNGERKFAYATFNAHQIHFYQVEDSRLVKLGEVIDSYARYMPDGSTSYYSVINDGNSPICFTDLSSTNNYVYALYSGRTFKNHRLSYRESEYLFVYDWSGKQFKSYHLDVPIVCFCIDEEDDKIYAIANMPEPTLVSFSIDI